MPLRGQDTYRQITGESLSMQKATQLYQELLQKKSSSNACYRESYGGGAVNIFNVTLKNQKSGASQNVDLMFTGGSTPSTDDDNVYIQANGAWQPIFRGPITEDYGVLKVRTPFTKETIPLPIVMTDSAIGAAGYSFHQSSMTCPTR